MALLTTLPSPRKQEADATIGAKGEFSRRERMLRASIIYDKSIDDDFSQALVVSNTTQAGDAYTGAAAEVIAINSGKAIYEVYQSAVATPGIVAPFQSADGLELRPVAAADALELTNGITSRSKAARTVGSLPTGKSYFEVKLKIDDISDVTEIFAGLRKAEAYQADPDNYDEMAAFNIGKDADGQVEIHTIKNNAATAEVDTTEDDVVDAGEHTLRIEVLNSGLCRFAFDGDIPTVTTQFTFDDAEVLVPFLHLNTETGDPGVSISVWRVGDL